MSDDDKPRPGRAIDFGKAREGLPTVFDEGVLTVTIENVEAVRNSRKGTISLLLEVRDVESGEFVDLEPIFVSSPTTQWELLAKRGQARVSDLLEAITGKAPGKLEPGQVCKLLTGKTVTIEVRIAADNNGIEKNRLVRVVGAAPDPGPNTLDGESDDEARI